MRLLAIIAKISSRNLIVATSVLSPAAKESGYARLKEDRSGTVDHVGMACVPPQETR